MKKGNKILSPQQKDVFIQTLQLRFEKNKHLHAGLDWAKINTKLNNNPEKLWALHQMELTGGEPDVVKFDKKQGNIYFTIVPRKVQPAEEAFVTIARPWMQEKKTNPKTMCSTWRPTWV